MFVVAICSWPSHSAMTVTSLSATRSRGDDLAGAVPAGLRHSPATQAGRSKLLHLGIERRYPGTRIMLLVADRDIRDINDDGELLAEFTIDPTKTYQTQKRPRQHA